MAPCIKWNAYTKEVCIIKQSLIIKSTSCLEISKTFISTVEMHAHQKYSGTDVINILALPIKAKLGAF